MEEEPEGAEIEQEEVEPEPGLRSQNVEGERARPRHRGGKQISFREQRDVYRYPEEGTADDYDNEVAGEQIEEEDEEEEEEEDPVVLAERLSFSCQVPSQSTDLEDAEKKEEEEGEEELFLMDETQERDRRGRSDLLTELSRASLRKRGKKEGE